MLRITGITVFILCLSCCLGMTVCHADEPVTLQTGRPVVTAGIRFEGATIPFWGQAPAGSQVVIRASGPITNRSVRSHNGLHRVFSPSIVCGLPSLYQILTSEPVQTIGGKVRREIGVDTEYTFLMADACVFNVNAGDEADESGYFAGLRVRQAVRQLVNDHLYGHFEDAVELQDGDYSGILHIPAGGPLTDIRLTAYMVKNNRIIGTASGSVQIPRRYFTRPFGQTPEEHTLYMAIMALSVIVCTITGVELLHKIKAGSTARK